MSHLRFSTNLLKRLGEELNSTPDAGILELVKNSYDADAINCSIDLHATLEIGGRITVSDDGVGMTKEDIENGWLVLGKSNKDDRKVSALGRNMVGSKGLGRLAALRMGSSTSLDTRPASQPNMAHSIDINWEEIDSHDVVEEVELKIDSVDRAPKLRQGTSITILNLRAALSHADVRRLARGIILLADPFGDNPSGFHPVLKTHAFEDLELLVSRRYFNEAEFHLHAEVDGDGQSRASVFDWRGGELYSAGHGDLRRKRQTSPYLCVNTVFDLWIFVLNQESFNLRTSSIGEVRNWLGEFGGVHLYDQGIRVSPYGDAGNDWLDMNLRRARSPELRPSTNTSIGRISVGSMGRLKQKTDRSGIIEDETFFSLKEFATDSMDWLTRRRVAEREHRRSVEQIAASEKTRKSKESVQELLRKIPRRTRYRLTKAIGQLENNIDREARVLRNEVHLYRTLSTAGITAAVFSHESKQPLKIALSAIGRTKRVGEERFGRPFVEILGNTLNGLERQFGVLKAFGSLTLSFLNHEKRRTGRVEVHKIIRELFELLGPFLEARKVDPRLLLDERGNPFLHGNRASIESIVTNLVTNSVNAFVNSGAGDRVIQIRTNINDGKLTILFDDSGPGIRDIGINEIWLPGETTYPDGTGLGLTIVRDSVEDLGGTIAVVRSGELGGAAFTIVLPLTGT